MCKRSRWNCCIFIFFWGSFTELNWCFYKFKRKETTYEEDKKLIKLIGVIILLLLIVALIFPTWTSQIKGKNSISTLEQVEINGSDHEIMIRGKDKNNPVIIFVHGGPGTSEIPYAQKYQNLLEEKFTVVNYDQRASGKSYHFFEDYSNLTSIFL